MATASHGSSFRYGSLSSQVLTFEVVLANGTLVNITRQSDPHLFRAWECSVGRLGIIHRLEFSIIKQQPIQRIEHDISFNEMAQQIGSAAAAYTCVRPLHARGHDGRWIPPLPPLFPRPFLCRAAKLQNSTLGMAQALQLLDETQMFWFVQTQSVWRVDFKRLDQAPPDALQNLQPMVQAMDGPGTSVPGAFQQVGAGCTRAPVF